MNEMVEINIRDEQRNLQVAAHFSVGSKVAIIGNNGAGKSSTLAAVAGSYLPSFGKITFGTQVFVDTAAKHYLRPASRPCGVLTQDPLLFPHLTVEQNIEFGPKAQKLKKADRMSRVAQVIAECELAPLVRRKPAELSGGEITRVGLARALAVAPKLLLLDEPLAAIDNDSAPLLRKIIAHNAIGKTLLIATHMLADIVELTELVLIVQPGKPSELVATLDLENFRKTHSVVDALYEQGAQ